MAKSQPRKSDTETLDTGGGHTVDLSEIICTFIPSTSIGGGVQIHNGSFGEKNKKSNPPRVSRTFSEISGFGFQLWVC